MHDFRNDPDGWRRTYFLESVKREERPLGDTVARFVLSLSLGFFAVSAAAHAVGWL